MSHNLRMKLLQKDWKLTLTQLREIAPVLEDAEKQAGTIEGKQEVNRVYRKEFKKESNQGRKTEKIKCFCCGLEGLEET